MRNVILTLIVATALTSTFSEAQQGTSNPNQPTQAQVKPTPCVLASASAPSQRIQIKSTSRWQQMINKKLKEVEIRSGITPPEISLDKLAAKAQAPSPCPTVPAAPTTNATTNPKQ